MLQTLLVTSRESYSFSYFLPGSYYTFIGTSITIIIIGGLFGAFRTAEKMKNLNWCQGTYTQKLSRIAIAYLLLIPSWVLQYYLPKIIADNLVTSFLINEFFLNMLHFTLIVYLEFGFLPFYVFHKLRLTNHNIGDYNFLPSRL